MQLIENLKWRYATKKMDATRKVSEEDMTKIKESIQLAASSYGLQPYTILDIRDTKLREQLQPLCWNQPQIVDASHLLVFCNQLNVSEEYVDSFVQLKANTNGLEVEQLAGYGSFVKGKLKEKSESEMFHWTEKQTYIALANALNACAELKIDSTPMEGFEGEKVNELLGLKEQGLNACVLLAIGYRSEEDGTQHARKVRKPSQDLIKEI